MLDRTGHRRSHCACVAILGVWASLVAAKPADASELRRTPIVQAVAKAAPSVVNIHGRKTVPTPDVNFGADAGRQVNGMGTGVVIDERGYIVTNYHVVDGVRQIQVTLADESTVIGRLIEHDPRTDLAIIKIDSDEPLPVIRVGSSHDLMPGEPVVAVGNAYGYSHTVSRGIISALHRTVQVSDEQKYQDLIQTDAAINPGNSGGPLLNIDGEMIGINVAVRVGAQGIGFAIPVDEAMQVAGALMSIEKRERLRHGIEGESVRMGESFQFFARTIRPGSPGEKAGLKPGDQVLSLADRDIERLLDIERTCLGRKAGDELALTVLREGQEVPLRLTLAESPAQALTSEEQIWSYFGLRLEPMPVEEFQQLKTRYRGGLRVTAVRPGSPGDAEGIRRSDVLVGMHIWETVALDNVRYILNRPDFAQLRPLKFYIVRGQETLYGHLQVSLQR
ncbi:MAG: trypsin-like peptidase domain-containing protein [Planctomycetes bacterium]|nr:trypsin-like peptidase domain-containing protein [Planctomycetota bacterium]